MESLIRLEKHAPSGTITLHRPHRRNALSRLMIHHLQRALETFHLDRSVRAVIITGSGSAFCAGLDLYEIDETSREKHAQQQWHKDAVQYKELLETMLFFPKPIIAAVNGPAVGGGAGLVLAADVAVAGPAARFGLPEPRRGLVAGIVAPLLAFRVGGSHAANLLLTARLVSADEAFRMGVYHELTASDAVLARAHGLAEECAKSAPESLQLTKKVLNETVGEQLGTLLSAGAAASATSRTTEAAVEGVTAFLQKREPKWP